VQPGEFAELLNTVLINVTSFFRDADAWDVLKAQVIPAVIANAADDRPDQGLECRLCAVRSRIRSRCCFAEVLGVQAEFCRRVKIYATDLDEDALKIARFATYTPHDVEGVRRSSWRSISSAPTITMCSSVTLRKCVIFGRHNVVNDAPISRIDLLTCRNLLIYLEAETQDVVLPRLHYALSRDGYLFLGKAETQLGRSSSVPSDRDEASHLHESAFRNGGGRWARRSAAAMRRVIGTAADGHANCLNRHP
jgi:two-component system CheB/CheR fusion protein